MPVLIMIIIKKNTEIFFFGKTTNECQFIQECEVNSMFSSHKRFLFNL